VLFFTQKGTRPFSLAGLLFVPLFFLLLCFSWAASQGVGDFLFFFFQVVVEGNLFLFFLPPPFPEKGKDSRTFDCFSPPQLEFRPFSFFPRPYEISITAPSFSDANRAGPPPPLLRLPVSPHGKAKVTLSPFSHFFFSFKRPAFFFLSIHPGRLSLLLLEAPRPSTFPHQKQRWFPLPSFQEPTSFFATVRKTVPLSSITA